MPLRAGKTGSYMRVGLFEPAVFVMSQHIAKAEFRAKYRRPCWSAGWLVISAGVSTAYSRRSMQPRRPSPRRRWEMAASLSNLPGRERLR